MRIPFEKRVTFWREHFYLGNSRQRLRHRCSMAGPASLRPRSSSSPSRRVDDKYGTAPEDRRWKYHQAESLQANKRRLRQPR